MDELLMETLAYYQSRILTGNNPAWDYLDKLELAERDLIVQLELGYGDGTLPGRWGTEKKRRAAELGLVFETGRERFQGYLTFAVRDRYRQFIDLWGDLVTGARQERRGLGERAKGLLGLDRIGEAEEICFCETPLYWLQAIQRHHKALGGLSAPDCVPNLHWIPDTVRHIRYVGRTARKEVVSVLEERGITVEILPIHRNGKVEFGEADRIAPAPNESIEIREAGAYLHLTQADIRLRVDKGVLTIPKRRIPVLLERADRRVNGNLDFTDHKSQASLAKARYRELGMDEYRLRRFLGDCGVRLDPLFLEQEKKAGPLPLPRCSTSEAQAKRILENEDILSFLTDLIHRCCGYAGNTDAVQLGLLVAASRLLHEPLGGLVRGPSGSGKSSLLKAIRSTLPEHQYLGVQRFSAQAMWFLPEDRLRHQALFIDELAGIADEYPLRSMLSQQELSTAITVREGPVPITRTVHKETRLSVLLSSSESLGPETVSRFIPIRLECGSEADREALLRMARPKKDMADLRLAHTLNGLLRPCEVDIPFAEDLINGISGPQARRRFGQLLGLIRSQAILRQYQRKTFEENGTLHVEAVWGDYMAIKDLIKPWIGTSYEGLSPTAQAILDYLLRNRIDVFTRHHVMAGVNCAYSSVHGAIKELKKLELITADHEENGKIQTYTLQLPQGEDHRPIGAIGKLLETENRSLAV